MVSRQTASGADAQERHKSVTTGLLPNNETATPHRQTIENLRI